MELAVKVMQNSIGENRDDKISPSVGAVLIKPDGTVDEAYRGEFSDGDHAEYTLLERKHPSDDLTGAVLFTTLEPCAPGARSEKKTSCAKRIVNRRIKKVWVGISDPDPLVDGKGIQYLTDNNVAVELFDRDLQEIIRKANANFIKGAEERASRAPSEPVQENLSKLEKPIATAGLDDLDAGWIKEFIGKAGNHQFAYGDDEFHRVFSQLMLLGEHNGNTHPTGLGILLFGKNPQLLFPHAALHATFRTVGRKEDIATFSGCLPKQAEDSIEWFRNIIGRQFDRSRAVRRAIYDYPDDVIRETINNALVHRSYDIDGASIPLEIDDDSIVIRSPGGTVKPITVEQMRGFNTPYKSRNPIITYVFEKLGLSENRGNGFRTIRDLPLTHKLPLPTVYFDNIYLVFTFSRAYGNGIGGQHEGLTAAEARGLDFIKLNSSVTRKAYAEHFALTGKTAVRHLTRFVELGLVNRVGSGPNILYEIIK
jgi:ATP-dependent DNA helicase RecG